MKKLLKLLVTLCMLITCFTANVFAAGEELIVTYNANVGPGVVYTGNVPTDSNKYDANATVTVLGNTGNLQRDDFNFAGWNTKYEGTGISYVEGSTFSITDHTTLYAVWEEKPYITIKISNKNESNGIVKVKFNSGDFIEYKEEDKDGSGNVKVTIPDDATTVTFSVVPGNNFGLRNSNLFVNNTEQKESIVDFENKLLSESGLTIDIGQNIVLVTDFGLPHPKWITVSWGGGNVQIENGQVFAQAIHIGENTYAKDVEEADEENNLFPISELIQTDDDGEEIMRTKGATLGETDLFVWDGCKEDVSIDFRFIPDYGYQVTNVVLNENLEESLLDSFDPTNEVSSFSFDFSKENNVHFIVIFTSKNDIINVEDTDLVENASISNGENATNSGNLQLDISDVDSESISDELAEAVGDNEAEYIQMDLSQVVDKAVNNETWNESITEFEDPINVTLNVPGLDPEGEYYIVREHTSTDSEGNPETICERIEVEYNPDDSSISFGTNKFSTYALVKDVLQNNEFRVEYDDRFNEEEGTHGASVVIGTDVILNCEKRSFNEKEEIVFKLNPPEDRFDDIPFVEIEVFDGDEETGNTLWATYLDVEDPHRLVINDNKFSFTPGKENPFIVRVIWSEYDWFGPEDGQYMIETNIFNNGTIVPSIDSVRSISHGYNQRKDCYTVGEDLILTLVPGENVFGDEEELEFVAIGADLFTKDGGEDEDEFTRPLSDLWNEKDQCYQIIIEDPEEFSQWYIEAHFTGETYRIIEGKNSVINIAKGNDATFVSNADISKFVKILIDGHEVDSNNYKKEEGSTKVILKAAYLKSLDVGKYVLEIVSIDGSASTLFTITNDIEPEPTPKPYIAPKTGVE
ncbi:MAG: InlB B-repeat-containing protein [Firmicutes bacterium]|nr:InlB B-repeat-containing protein [Candidatus Colivicinus equi]